ncbi:MAG: transcription initiation factor IIB family protein, partial [Saccharolobus sp.]
KDIAEALEITEVTIRNRYKEIVDNFDITVML